ncbi:hypothetical protein FQZ97_944760 [compost metagenome]
MELPAADYGLEAWCGTGNGVHRGGQAGRADVAVGAAFRRTGGGGGYPRRGGQHRHRARQPGRCGDGDSPGHRQTELHRFDAGGGFGRQVRHAPDEAADPRTRRQVPGDRARRCRHQGRRPGRGQWRVLQLRAGLRCGDARLYSPQHLRRIPPRTGRLHANPEGCARPGPRLLHQPAGLEAAAGAGAWLHRRRQGRGRRGLLWR